MNIKIVVEDQYLPQYANPTDACLDLRAKIQNNIKPLNLVGKMYRELKRLFGPVVGDTEDTIVIMPGTTRKVRTGVQVAIPEGHVMQMFVRSSTGIKKNLCLANGTGIIDAGYRDEVIMALHNFGSEPVCIVNGDRLCQFLILPYPKINLEQVEDNEDFRSGDRGGGIGSTGK